MIAASALAQCTNVGRTYGTGRTAVVALHGVTCHVDPADQIAVVGASGSGKTTLLHLLAGIDEPTTGVVEWPGIGNPNRLRPWPISVVFQGPSLLPPLDVCENVALPVLLLGADLETAHAAAQAALGRLGLDALARKLPDELSGGQGQRVAVARALASSPRLILADEPTGQLDRETGREVIDALVEITRDTRAALVVATHDVDIAARFGRRWEMHDGALHADPMGSNATLRGESCSA